MSDSSPSGAPMAGAGAAGHGAMRGHGAEPPPAMRPPILVVEDDATNRDLIRRQLERLGHRCVLAGDGAEALQRWCEDRYPLVLTDVQMPRMDGFELIAAIRSRECDVATGARTRVVAITASAVRGEVERCLAAGMDDFLPKPLDLPRLRAMLARWQGSAPPSAAGATAAPAGGGGAARDAGPVDARVLAEILGDDPAGAREVLESFMTTARALVSAAESACRERSADEVRAVAHKLKSAAGSIGAHALADACAALERAAQAHQWPAIDGLAAELDGLLSAVAGHVARSSAQGAPR